MGNWAARAGPNIKHQWEDGKTIRSNTKAGGQETTEVGGAKGSVIRFSSLSEDLLEES